MTPFSFIFFKSYNRIKEKEKKKMAKKEKEIGNLIWELETLYISQLNKQLDMANKDAITVAIELLELTRERNKVKAQLRELGVY